MKNTNKAAIASKKRKIKKGIQKFFTCSWLVIKKKSTKNMTNRKARTSQKTIFYRDLNNANISMMKKKDATIIIMICSRVKSPN